MDPDEIAYNPFYHLLRNEFRKKYEFAVAKCWTICIPRQGSSQISLITDKFYDDHVLKPSLDLPLWFTTTDEEDPRTYKLDGDWLEMVRHDERDSSDDTDAYRVKITSMEKGYNKEFQVYLIFILDKPLRPEYIPYLGLAQNEAKLNRCIASYDEALAFLEEFSGSSGLQLEKLTSDLKKLDLEDYCSADEYSATLKKLTRRYWAAIMRTHSLELQRDARFQKLLSTSLEVFIMHTVHDQVYALFNNVLGREDIRVNEKLNALLTAGVTPDQLGADESLAILLPAAVVELAMLDARKGPLEKLLCLRTTLDLIIAEVKAAFADVEARRDVRTTDTNDERFARDAASSSSSLSSSSLLSVSPRSSLSGNELVSLLAYVIVKSRPRRLVTDLHYVQNFTWSASPRDGLFYALAIFEAAVSALYRIQVQSLPRRSDKVKTELPIEELLDVISRSPHSNASPLDRQTYRLAAMLEKCTQN